MAFPSRLTAALTVALLCTSSVAGAVDLPREFGDPEQRFFRDYRDRATDAIKRVEALFPRDRPLDESEVRSRFRDQCERVRDQQRKLRLRLDQERVIIQLYPDRSDQFVNLALAEPFLEDEVKLWNDMCSRLRSYAVLHNRLLREAENLKATNTNWMVKSIDLSQQIEKIAGWYGALDENFQRPLRELANMFDQLPDNESDGASFALRFVNPVRLFVNVDLPRLAAATQNVALRLRRNRGIYKDFLDDIVEQRFERYLEDVNTILELDFEYDESKNPYREHWQKMRENSRRAYGVFRRHLDFYTNELAPVFKGRYLSDITTALPTSRDEELLSAIEDAVEKAQDLCERTQAKAENRELDALSEELESLCDAVEMR